MRDYAVIGHPVAHSLSPRIHGEFARQTQSEVDYAAIDVTPEEFGEFWKTGEGQGLAGANITLPHKELAFELADSLTLRAQQAGAVNTIRREPEGRLLGDNTDGFGLVRDLTRNLGLELKERRLLLVGAGGAAAGVLGPILSRNPLEVVIANRTKDRARALCRRFGEDGYVVAASLDELHRLGAFNGILHASAAGHEGQAPELPDSLVADSTWCYDLSYGETAQPFLDWAESQQATGHDGLGMLVEQAAESFRVWHGIQPDTAPVLAGLREG